MADSTSYLTQKIQVLEQQIQNFELERFQHSLVVTDLDPAETDTTIVNALSAQAASAKQAMAVAERRLVVRKAELTKLQAEQKALNTPV